MKNKLLTLDLQINNPGRFPVNSERLFGVVKKQLESPKSGVLSDKSVEISLLFTDKKQMGEYNLKYHDTGGPTDVLSFPYTDPQSLPKEAEGFVTPPDAGIILGDIIVCYEVAEEIAVKENKTVDEMVEFYVLHGLEHLLGHHHE